VAVWGSTDGVNWGSKPLVQFPQKFYCASYSLHIDLSEHPDIEFMQVRWKVNRWGRGDARPLFGFYVFSQTATARAMAASAA
jgi:hypothetical protein